MSSLKTFKRRLAVLVLPVLGDLLVRLIHDTCRWSIVGLDNISPLLKSGRPFCGATWHYCLISGIYYFKSTKFVVMVSRSSDGEAVARMVERWGFLTARGSKLKGGREAAVEMIRLVKDGYNAGLVADGSQGPARKAQSGPVFIARAAKAPLIPIVVVAKRKITLGTWDRMQIPLPFTRLAVYIGEPIQVPPKNQGGSLEKYRAELEESLNDLVRRAESHPW